VKPENLKTVRPPSGESAFIASDQRPLTESVVNTRNREKESYPSSLYSFRVCGNSFLLHAPPFIAVTTDKRGYRKLLFSFQSHLCLSAVPLQLCKILKWQCKNQNFGANTAKT